MASINSIGLAMGRYRPSSPPRKTTPSHYKAGPSLSFLLPEEKERGGRGGRLFTSRPLVCLLVTISSIFGIVRKKRHAIPKGNG
jgi:hypothetical protein